MFIKLTKFTTWEQEHLLREQRYRHIPILRQDIHLIRVREMIIMITVELHSCRDMLHQQEMLLFALVIVCGTSHGRRAP